MLWLQEQNAQFSNPDAIGPLSFRVVLDMRACWLPQASDPPLAVPICINFSPSYIYIYETPDQPQSGSYVNHIHDFLERRDIQNLREIRMFMIFCKKRRIRKFGPHGVHINAYIRSHNRTSGGAVDQELSMIRYGFTYFYMVFI